MDDIKINFKEGYETIYQGCYDISFDRNFLSFKCRPDYDDRVLKEQNKYWTALGQRPFIPVSRSVSIHINNITNYTKT